MTLDTQQCAGDHLAVKHLTARHNGRLDGQTCFPWDFRPGILHRFGDFPLKVNRPIAQAIHSRLNDLRQLSLTDHLQGLKAGGKHFVQFDGQNVCSRPAHHPIQDTLNSHCQSRIVTQRLRKVEGFGFRHLDRIPSLHEFPGPGQFSNGTCALQVPCGALIPRAQDQGTLYDPRFDEVDVDLHRGGLIVTSACRFNNPNDQAKFRVLKDA